jgi:protein TonB
MFWIMIGFSAALHGLILISVAESGLRTLPPVSEHQLASTLKMIKIKTRQQEPEPITPIEQKIIRKSIEVPPELSPVQEPILSEEVREDHEIQENNSGNNEAQEIDGQEDNNTGNNEDVSNGGAGEDGTMTDREYEALLAYIKDFINKNLVYPPMARRRNIQGTVGVSFEIDNNGVVSAITVNHSAGSSILDNAAVSLVKNIHLLENMTIKRRLALKVNIDYELTE